LRIEGFEERLVEIGDGGDRGIACLPREDLCQISGRADARQVGDGPRENRDKIVDRREIDFWPKVGPAECRPEIDRLFENALLRRDGFADDPRI